ncbi:hypothetical protein BY996DRAFT_6571583 [Phakopsora pachyrhizi]|nr:hypothetical protein BY996DRAFT_6571583 [Phakopsora pachyrhizi]
MSLTQSSGNDEPSSNTQALLDWVKRHPQSAEEAQGRKKELSRLLYKAEQDNNKHSNLKKTPEPQGSHQPIQDQVKDLIMENVNTVYEGATRAHSKITIEMMADLLTAIEEEPAMTQAKMAEFFSKNYNISISGPTISRKL